MAVIFITGKPGHGKTLYAIWHVKKYIDKEHADRLKSDSQAEPRTVYQHGIHGLTLPWLKLDEPADWYKLPTGSVIVIDECQRHFPSMATSAKRPKSYTEIDTHRHNGFDIFLITQDPVNVDQRFKSMSDRHYHIARSYNTERATLYEYQAVEYVSGTRYKKIPDALKSQWNYPKEVYTWYKSAEVHTYKQRLPLKKLIIVIAPFALVIFLVPWFFSRVKNKAVDTTPVSSTGSPLVNSEGTVGIRNPLSRQFSTSAFVPLIKDEPLTTPFFQSVIEVRDYPRISGCGHIKIASFSECRCNDQRGNLIRISHSRCMAIVVNGYFDYSLDGSDYEDAQAQENLNDGSNNERRTLQDSDRNTQTTNNSNTNNR